MTTSPRRPIHPAAAMIVLTSGGDLPTTAGPPPPCCTVQLKVRVPENTGTVYLTGSLPQLGPWHADGLALSGTGRERTVQLTVPQGTAIEYRLTLGSWDRIELGYAGADAPSHRVLLERDTVVELDIPAFKLHPKDYIADWEGSGVQGRLVYWTDVHSAFLKRARHVEIWLPPGYDDDTSQHYPVLYMQDGQNLFDPRITFGSVDWGVDEAVTRLIKRGSIQPVLVVGIWNTADRFAEYSPWHHAPDYARFLIEELMPRVNAAFRTRTGPGNTAAMGSSMGGLLSFYLVTHHPEVFGACGCLSSHLPLSEAFIAPFLRDSAAPTHPDTIPYIIHDIQSGLHAPRGVRYWFDYGTIGLDSTYAPTHAAVRDWLLAEGMTEGRDFVVRAYPGASHSEASWRARLDDPLTFLFGTRHP